jgi:hypothetical protein
VQLQVPKYNQVREYKQVREYTGIAARPPSKKWFQSSRAVF